VVDGDSWKEVDVVLGRRIFRSIGLSDFRHHVLGEA
jgi:hypothetical protein